MVTKTLKETKVDIEDNIITLIIEMLNRIPKLKFDFPWNFIELLKLGFRVLRQP
jgi:hypothetical protein